MLGPISILVDNAGVASRGQRVSDTKPDEVAYLLGAHAVGSHHLCRLVMPHMRECERGDLHGVAVEDGALLASAPEGGAVLVIDWVDAEAPG